MGYWKGILSQRVVLDAYVRQPDDSFRNAPRTTAFDVKDGEPPYLQYGQDLDGDALPDLLVRTEERWLLHSGLPSSSGKKLVQRKPRTLPLPEVKGHPLVDVGSFSSSGGPSWTRISEEERPRFTDLGLLLVRPGSDSRPGTFHILWPGTDG
jgi:hypothetical protein